MPFERSMALAIASTSETGEALRRGGLGRIRLGPRILAINLLSVLLVGASFLWLDSYRNQLAERRLREVAAQADLMVQALRATDRTAPGLLLALAQTSDSRMRIYGPSGRRTADSWALAPPNFAIAAEPENSVAKRIAARLDDLVDSVVFARRPPRYAEPRTDEGSAWPEVVAARTGSGSLPSLRLAADRTAVISVAREIDDRRTLLVTVNARDLRRDVRAERLRMATAVLMALLVTALLSAHLARTIVTPIRRLAIAAQRVRLGRRRDVVVPRMLDRSDEIGLLARALSDMTQALRARADAIEAFAADVSHELKNPLASLASAVQTLERVDDPDLQRQLIAIVADDARRMDRLVTDIAEASRLDAKLARTLFEPIDLSSVLEAAVFDLRGSAEQSGVRLALARPKSGSILVSGLDTQLRRAFDNVIANALSFAPDGSLVEVRVHCTDDRVEIAVEDQGSGVLEASREAIFRRFHSDRPEAHRGGGHSGLGLAIAKVIVEGHGGSISVSDRADGRTGARFTILLPLERTAP